MTKEFTVEAWRGMECIAFRRVARVATVRSTADTYIIDREADRVYVSREGVTGYVATWQVTGGWRGDLAEAMEADR